MYKPKIFFNNINNAGCCGKCGAPFSYPSGPWHGILPPPPIASCNCWNNKTITITGTSTECIYTSKGENKNG